MTLTQFTNLDFDQIKASIRDYLRANSNFTDYDFEGSNFSTLINTLAYNTYINSYNANAIVGEIFLDSATLRENVVSRAKEIGYLPRSRTAARANISFFVDTNNLTTNPISLTLRRGTVCVSSGSLNGESYSFCILDDITVPVVDGFALFNNITVYEGTFVTENYTFSENEKIILSNIGVDTSLISVSVRDSIGSSFSQKYNLSRNIFNIDGTSRVFYLQEIQDELYEIFFGDDIFGKKLESGNIVDITYVACAGERANSVSSVAFTGRIFDNNGRIVTSDISRVTVDTPAFGGKSIESTESIKRYAPRVYAAQNRAVTASDYEAIVKQIYPEAESISVFGGETLSPPRFGRVFISIKPINGPFVSNLVKDNIKSSLRQYAVAGIVPDIIDLKFLYVEFQTAVYYNSNFTISPQEIQSKVFNNLEKYSKSAELNRYGARFKYSKFINIIDESSEGITSNITTIKIRRDLKVEENRLTNYEICFGNEFYSKNCDGFNIKSSGFFIAGIQEPVYLADRPINDESGEIFLFTTSGEEGVNILRNNAGRVDYKKGEILLFSINITDTIKSFGTDKIVEIVAIPKSNDVIGLQDLYLQLDVSNSTVNMIIDNISSGSDISGSDYITTSSFANNKKIRQ